MKQRSALIVSVMVTAFILVIAGGIATAMLRPGATAAPVTTSTVAPAQVPDQPVVPVISADQAVRIASSSTMNAQLQNQPELVNFQGTAAYEVVLDQGTVYVDASNGQVLHNGITAATASTAGEAYENEYDEQYEYEDEHESREYEHESREYEHESREHER